jgi:hypothetical protein
MCFWVNKYSKTSFIQGKIIIGSTFQPPKMVGGGTKGDMLFVKLNNTLSVVFFL